MKRAVWIHFLLGITLFAAHAMAAGQVLSPDEVSRLKKTPTQTSLTFESYGLPNDVSIGLIGFHFDQFLSRGFYWGPAVYGAITGNRGGYGVAAIGLGFQQELISRRLFWDSKVMAGSGGGSGTRTGGGFLLHGVTGFQVELFSGVRLAVHGGYLDFPTGEFRTPVGRVTVVFTGRKVTLPF